jgi:hypothetical protein
MSDDKKPKKDLRARLGRTIVPGTPGVAPIAPPPVGGAGEAPVPQPPAPASVPPPAVVPPPVAPVAPAVPGAAPFAPLAVTPPPFAQPASPSEPPKPKAPADPFAVAAPVAARPQEVRLVIDEKPVDEAEIGRKQRTRNFVLVGVGLLVGAALGGSFVSMNNRNVLYNVTVRDGRDIYNTVTQASSVVLSAQQKVDQILRAAAGGPGQSPRVDYDAIRELRALEQPFDAGAFARKNYNAFQPATVDDLFTYYQNVQALWQRFQRLADSTLPDARRAELDRTAALGGEVSTAVYGAVPIATDEGVRGSLVFVEFPAEQNQREPTKVVARPRRGGPGRELQIFTADTEIGSTATHVMLIDGAQSAGVLSEQLGAFRIFVNDIREIKALVDQTVEVQGRLTTSLGEIARLEERFAF